MTPDTTDVDAAIRFGRRAWQFVPRGPSAAVLYPHSRDPSEYEWPVDGMHVLVFARVELKRTTSILVVELLNAGARYVQVFYSDGRVVGYDPRRGEKLRTDAA